MSRASEELPLLSGLNPLDLQLGHRIESPQVQAALNLIERFNRSPMAGLVDLERIDISVPEVLVVRTGQGSEVTFGLQDLDRQLRRWRAVYDFGLSGHKAVASLDLAVSRNTPVRWLEAGVASSAAKTPKAPRPKRKNV
jgi:hypothetical protein